jgi:hypothetical protein
MIEIRERIKQLEELLETNIARTILDLEIHRNMELKKIKKYYGEDFSEKDRQGLIEDTVRKAEWDTMLLKELRKQKKNITEKYTYDQIEKGDFRRISSRCNNNCDR